MKKFLAFDIGGTNTRLALVNENLEIEKELIANTPLDDKDAFMNNCFQMIDKFDLKNVVAVGAGVPGVVDREKGVILDLPNVYIKNIDFCDQITKKYGFPVYLRNDAEVACLGEAYFGAGKDYDRVFFITISTGLGGALCVDKKCQDYVTEIGHTLFLYKNTVQEYSIIAGRRIEVFANLNGSDLDNPKAIFEEMRKGTEVGKVLQKEWVNIFDKFLKLVKDSYCPDVICMTGGIFSEKDLFFNELLERNSDLNIVECEFETHAGIIGAATYAMQCTKNIWFIFFNRI